MEFSTKVTAPEKYSGACVAVGVCEQSKLSAAASALDAASRGQIRDFLRSGDMDGRPGTTCVLYEVRGISAERVLLVGLGPEKEFDEKQFRNCSRTAIKAIGDTGAREACLSFSELPVRGRGFTWRSRQ